MKSIKIILDDTLLGETPLDPNNTITNLLDYGTLIAKNHGKDSYMVDIYIDRKSKLDINQIDKNTVLGPYFKYFTDPHIHAYKSDTSFPTLTGIKDVDTIILSKLSDKDLRNLCMVNKYSQSLCDNDLFWKRRFVNKYGERAVKYKPANKTWKEHYYFVHYLIVNTGYTSRIVKKMKMKTQKVKSGELEYNQVYENKKVKTKNKSFMDKGVYIQDSLWGEGLYSIGDIEETLKVFQTVKSNMRDLDGYIVYRIDNEDDTEEFLDFLYELHYCEIYDRRFDEYSDSDDEDDVNNNEDKMYQFDDMNIHRIDLDAESG